MDFGDTYLPRSNYRLSHSTSVSRMLEMNFTFHIAGSSLPAPFGHHSITSPSTILKPASFAPTSIRLVFLPIHACPVPIHSGSPLAVSSAAAALPAGGRPGCNHKLCQGKLHHSQLVGGLRVNVPVGVPPSSASSSPASHCRCRQHRRPQQRVPLLRSGC